MKKLLHYLLLICFCSSISFALSANDRPGPKKHKELQAYMQQQIMPVLKEHRQQFDKQLSPADKRKVEQLRQELRKLHSQREKLRKNAHKRHEEITPEQQAKLKTLHENRRRIYAEAGELAKKYRPQLERIHASLASYKTTWETDLKALANQENTASDARPSGRRYHKHMGRMMKFRHVMRPVNFILWDVPGMHAPENLGTAARNSVYPNPTITTNTVAYTVAETGPVKITLVNAQGTNTRVLLNEEKTAGDFSLDVNTQNLPGGLYFYKIETAAGVETLRFLKR